MIVAAPLAALLLAGCGGGGGGDSTAAPAVARAPTTTTLTKQDLISQGDAICAEVNAAVGTVSASADTSSRISQEADLYSGMVDRLKALGAPEDSSGYSEFIAAAGELAQAESDARLAAERGDETGLSEAETSASAALSSFQSAAQSYGFENCAEGPSAPATTTPGTAGEEVSEEPSEVVEGEEEVVEEAAPEEEAAAEPEAETGGAGTAEEAPGGGTGGGTEGGGVSGGGSGGIGPG